MLFDQLHTAFSSFQMDIEAIVAEGDLVVVRGTMTGTHTSEFLDVPATGKEVRVPFCDWTCLRDGKAVEFFEYYDTAAVHAAAT